MTPATADHDFAIPPIAWDAGEDEGLYCVAIHDETHDVRTFTFRTQPARRFAYRPGQFVTLALEIDGERVNRCYTLSSSPTRPDSLSITVKRVPGGKVSNWLHDRLKPGMTLSVLGPAGDFYLSARPPQPLLLLSAGSGITPMMSMTRALYDLGQALDLVFLHSARSPVDLVFADELAVMARRRGGLRLISIVESRQGDAAWPGLVGRLDSAQLAQLVPDLAAREVYCCGPSPYMAAVRGGLAASGFAMARYHEESFSFDPPELCAPAATSHAQAGLPVRFARLGEVVQVAPGQTILAAAQQQGLRMPSSCARGLCGTCKTRLMEGQVDMRHSGGIRQREIDQGWILPCCSVPLGPVVLDR